MGNIYLVIEINDEGRPRRASNDPPLHATKEQLETWNNLYTAYQAEKRAWWHWFNLREHFKKHREPDAFDQHWLKVANETERELREADMPTARLTRKVS